MLQYIGVREHFIHARESQLPVGLETRFIEKLVDGAIVRERRECPLEPQHMQTQPSKDCWLDVVELARSAPFG